MQSNLNVSKRELKRKSISICPEMPRIDRMILALENDIKNKKKDTETNEFNNDLILLRSKLDDLFFFRPNVISNNFLS